MCWHQPYRSKCREKPCTWMESALMQKKSWTKTYHSQIKKYKSQCIGKQNGVCDSVFFSKNDACLPLKKIWKQASGSAQQDVNNNGKLDHQVNAILAHYRILSELKRTECWQTLNQSFWFHHFQTIISFHLKPPIFFTASNDWSWARKKIQAKKIARLCAGPFETWHKAPLFFHNHD